MTDKKIVDQIISMKKNGASIWEISKSTGVSNNTVAKYCRWYDLPVEEKSPKYTKDEINILIDGKKKGMTYAEIAEKLGRSILSVITKAKNLRRAGILEAMPLQINSVVPKNSEMRKHNISKVMKLRRWSVDDVAKLKLLCENGTSWDNIANELGRTAGACKIKYQKVSDDGVIPVYATNKTVTIKGDDMRKSLEDYTVEEILEYLWNIGVRIINNEPVIYKPIELNFKRNASQYA